MNYHRRKYMNRLGNTDFLQRIILYFLIGFFCGAVFYYSFQNSFAGMQKQLERNLTQWSAQGLPFLSLFGKSVWNHGKYFVLMWILSASKISRSYQKFFTLYTGVRNGFLMLFFLFTRNIYGMVLYIASLFPHVLLLVPLYIFSFIVIHEKRQVRHKGVFVVFLLLVFGAACFLEVKCNLPLMEKCL